jgi:ABC-type Mn2+/Zn2+ transport system ATPase subunit
VNTLPLLHFLTFLIYTGMFFYLLKADLESRLNRVLAAFIGCFGLWSFSSIIIFQPNIAENTAILMDRIASLGWVSLNSFYLWFAFLFAEKKKVLKTNFIYFIFFVPPLIFIYKIWTGFLISGYSEQPWGWARIWSDSIWPYSFFLYLLSFSFVALYLIYDFGKKTKMPLKQKQVRVIFYTSLISLIIGTITDILLPLYSVDEFPPLANVAYLILVGGVVYSIVKYRFIRVTPYMAAEQIISTMADSLILLDKGSNITGVNEALLNLSGYEKEELLGKTIELFCNKSDMKQILADRLEDGSIIINNKPVRFRSPLDAVNHGVSLVPEDRKKDALILMLELYKNITLPTLEQFTSKGVILSGKEIAATRRAIEKLDIKTSGVKQITRYLSGGNQQKVAISKWLQANPIVLIMDEPTQGIDVKAKLEIYNIVRKLAETGVCIIFISSEVSEVVKVSDRIIVLSQGKISAEFKHGISQEEIMRTMLKEE